MGLTKGTITFTRYRVEGNQPDNFPDFVDRQIKLFSFKETVALREKATGWTSLDNVLDTNFEYANYSLGNYIVFSFRIDRAVIPAALLKLKVLEAERRYMAEQKKEKLYREERNNIKESVRRNLLEKVDTVPSSYDVCWCPQENWLIFGSLAEKITIDFEELFKRSFNLKPLSYTPWEEKKTGGTPAPPLQEAPPDSASGLLSLPGRDFLTWLWFKSEERNGTIMIPGIGDMELIFLQRLVLESGEGEYAETVVCRGLHADLSEGKTALRKEKKIKEARLRLTIGNDQMEFTFKADRFQFQSLKILADFTGDEANEEDKEGRMLERIYYIERAVTTMEKLFALFLERRLSPRWEHEEIPKIKTWISH